MKKLVLMAMFIGGFVFTGSTQEETKEKPQRMKLYPVEHKEKASTPASERTHANSIEKLSKEEVEQAILSIEGKIEVLRTEDPVGNAQEIEEKQNLLAKYKNRLQTLNQGK